MGNAFWWTLLAHLQNTSLRRSPMAGVDLLEFDGCYGCFPCVEVLSRWRPDGGFWPFRFRRRCHPSTSLTLLVFTAFRYTVYVAGVQALTVVQVISMYSLSWLRILISHIVRRSTNSLGGGVNAVEVLSSKRKLFHVLHDFVRVINFVGNAYLIFFPNRASLHLGFKL